MARNSFDFERVLANEHAKVLISGSGIRVRGVFTNNLVVRAGNDFNSLLEGGGDSLNQSVNKFIGSFNILSGFADSDVSIDAVVLKNLQQTVKMWTGSEIPSFSVSMVFIATRPGDNVVSLVSDLYSSVFPVAQSTNITVTPPLGYTAGGKGSVIQGGGLIISIGTWFRAVNQVMKSVQFEFSKEVTIDGNPLYAFGTIEFEHYRALTFPEFRKFFVNIPSRTSGTNRAKSKEETSFKENQPSGTVASDVS